MKGFLKHCQKTQNPNYKTQTKHNFQITKLQTEVVCDL